jgi:hypothetical protein
VKLLLSWLREHVDVTLEPARLAADLTAVGRGVDALASSGSGTTGSSTSTRRRTASTA